MFELLRRHCFVLAIGVLLWQGWSRAQATQASSADEAGVLPPAARIEPAAVPMRRALEARLDPEDPFFLTELLELRQRLDEAQGAPAQASGNSSAVAAGGGSPLSLVLRSTVPGPDARAWINGHDVRVGEAIPLAGEADPPVLLEVGGTSVLVRWHGRRIRLDLDGPAVLEDLR